jgi:hypothetical protein
MSVFEPKPCQHVINVFAYHDKHNYPSNHFFKNLFFFYVYHGGLEYICNCVLKNTNILKNEIILNLIRFIVSISYVIPHILNHVYEPCESLITFI